MVFRRRVVLNDPQGVLAAFSEDTVVHAGDDLPSAAYAETLTRMPVLSGPVLALAGSEDPAVVASALEFVLEGLHLTKRLNKEAAGTRATYRGRG
jgi:magnesium chelatase subunit I